MRVAAADRESLLQRAVDWVFGYDFFISYSHGDGQGYPRRLKQRLEAAGFRVFLDQTEYVAGLDLRRETRRQVTKSRKIVVIGRPAALRSPWVKREVDVALTRGKTPIVIDVNDAVSAGPLDAELAVMARDSHWLRLNERLEDPDGEPSLHTGDELVRGFKHTRQETLRVRVFAGAAALLAILALGATLAAVEARRQRSVAERNFEAAKQAADGLVIDIAHGLRDVQGMRIESLHKILDRSAKTFESLLASDPQNPALIRSRAAMLREFTETYLGFGAIDAARESARRAVDLDESLVQRAPADATSQRNLALSLVKLGDVATEKGDLPEARHAYERGLAIREQLAARDEKDLVAARDVTISLMRLGEIAETAGDYPASLALCERALAMRQDLVRKQPEWKRDLIVSFTKVGDLELTLGDFPASGAAFEAAIATARELHDADPTSTRFLRDLAVGWQRQGNLGVKTRAAAAATKAYQESMARFRELVRLDPENLEWSGDIAITEFKLGQAAVVAGDVPAAIGHFEAALALRRALLAKSAENHMIRTDIAENLLELSEVSPGTAKAERLREARTLLLALKSEGRTGSEQERWLASIEQKLVQAEGADSR